MTAYARVVQAKRIFAAVRFIERRLAFKVQNFVCKPDCSEHPDFFIGIKRKAGLKMPNVLDPSFPNNHEFLGFVPMFKFCLKRMFIKCHLTHGTFFVQSNTIFVKGRIKIYLTRLHALWKISFLHEKIHFGIAIFGMGH